MARERIFKVTGLKELDAKLIKLETKLRTKIIRKATREATKYVAADAMRLVPEDTGKLRQSIKVRARKRSRRNRGSIGHSIVGGHKQITKGLPYYAQFIEFGTKFIPEDPFLRPALYGNQHRVRKLFARRIREGLRALT